ncbi:MAG: hypothetical protein GY853_10975 [PVC group bacterium]|nr:hypothetical protein [PVC group bacterium]
MEWLEKFDEMQSSALKELANIGISHAATAIGEIAKEEIDVSLPELKVFSKQEIVDLNSEGRLTGAYMKVSGIAEITETLIIASEDSARELMNRFINGYTENLTLDEQKSIFKEIATIISATYFSAIGGLFNIQIHPGIPQVSFQNGGMIDLMNRKMLQNEGISIKASLMGKESRLQVLFFLIPDPQTLDGFFKGIGLM